MLTALKIQGFKAVFDASLSSIGPFTLLIGRNGAGKSSAVEAIQWLRDATFLGVGAATSGYVGFDDLVNRRSKSLRLDLRYQPAKRIRPGAATRPPIGKVELVYMDPTFEAMLLQDGAALRKVFGFTRAPPGWPALPFAEDRPDFKLREVVNAHRRKGPTYLRVTYDAAKHAWAQEILRNATPKSAIWDHDIARRLGKVLG